ncbi:MAG: DUF72 domain-containing protein, partial [Chthoniobacteraceae bacterium]
MRSILHQVQRGVFNPPGLSQKRELAFASETFNSIEINGSFYSWYEQTPADSVFSMKGGRSIT